MGINGSFVMSTLPLSGGDINQKAAGRSDLKGGPKPEVSAVRVHRLSASPVDWMRDDQTDLECPKKTIENSIVAVGAALEQRRRAVAPNTVAKPSLGLFCLRLNCRLC
jgi:hypothetical protein